MHINQRYMDLPLTNTAAPCLSEILLLVYLSSCCLFCIFLFILVHSCSFLSPRVVSYQLSLFIVTSLIFMTAHRPSNSYELKSWNRYMPILSALLDSAIASCMLITPTPSKPQSTSPFQACTLLLTGSTTLLLPLGHHFFVLSPIIERT